MSKETITHPDHYCKGGFEAVEIIDAFQLCFKIGNVVKYCLRAKFKGNELEDLKKARNYLEMKIKKLEGR